MEIIRLKKYGRTRDYGKVECLFCKRHFYKRLSFIKQNPQHFCGRFCYLKFIEIPLRPLQKTCRQCKKSLPINNFYKRLRSKDGLKSICIDCNKLREATIYKERINTYATCNREDALHRNRKSHLQRTYGITIEDYNALLEIQNSVCKICKNPETKTYRGKLKPLAVDHCHITGKVRGLLCDSCNNALGKFKDSISYLKEAIKYLEEYNEK